MSTPDSIILGFRTQILENWRYMYPDKINVVIITTCDTKALADERYAAFIAEHRSQGSRIFLKASSPDSHEGALRVLLHRTSMCMNDLLKGKSVQYSEPEPLGQDATNVKETVDKSIKTEPDAQTPETKKLKRFHEALGHVIDLASGE